MARSAGRRPLIDILTARFPDNDREFWYSAVMCGEIFVDGGVCTDPRAPVAPDAGIEHHRERYVSRGGLKLEHALRVWHVPVCGRVWLDAGASTGGFTDCLLQHGAGAVHAVDVGYNQLAWRLRRDRRVHVHERTNVRELPPLQPVPHAAVCDLSFRSLRGVLRHVLQHTTEGWGIALLKPQFEAAAEERWGERAAGTLEGGVLTGTLRDQVVASTLEALGRDEGIAVRAAIDSPVTGRGGNREILLWVGLVDRWSRAQLRKSEGESGAPT